jgi:protein phosphatase
MVQQMVDAGLIAQEEAATHPNANQISRALGMKADVEVEVRKTPVVFVAGDAFVLCSDGLSDLVSAREILEIVGSVPAAQAVGQLVDLANARGGHDNITVQILRARESAIAVSEGAAPVAPTVADTVGKTIPDAGTAADAARSTHVPPHPNRARRALATTSNDEGEGSRRRSPVVIVGIVLALAGLGVAGGLLWFMGHKPTKKVPVFVDEPEAAAPVPVPVPTTSVEDTFRPEPSAAPSLAPLVAPDAGRRRPHREPGESPSSAPSPTPTPVPIPVPLPISTDPKIEW